MKTKLALAISAALLTSNAYAQNNNTINQVSLQPTNAKNQINQTGSISGLKDQQDSVTGQTTFQWAKHDRIKPDLGPLEAKYKLTFAADFYLNRVAGVSTNKNTNLKPVLASVHENRTGAFIAKYQQEYLGIEVFNQSINILMDKEYNLVASSGRFASANGENSRFINDNFGSAATAVKSAFSAMGGNNLSVSENSTHSKYTSFTVTNADDNKFVKGTPRTKKVYFEHKGKLVPSYYVELEVADAESVDSEYYSFVINSQTNEILFKHNLTAQDSAFNYRVYADETGVPWDSPHGNVVPAASEDQVDATAYLDAPMVTISSGPISTNDAWLTEDATTTNGNNVFAYVDAIAPDGFSNGDYTAATTAAMTFDYKYNTNELESSVNNRKAAIVNLFYINNYLHDTFYDHGFDEASGNAQALNYDRGGEEGDAINAEVQDNSGFNNANMSTPADGGSPRMQMYLWDSKDAIVGEHYGVTVTSDAGIGLLTSTQRASFGQGQFDIAGDVVRLIDDTAPLNDGCTAATNAADLAGKIAIIDRGVCGFTAKALAAQNAGAIAVLIANNSGTTEPAPMGGTDDKVKIPSMGLSKDDGAKIYAQLDADVAVSISMFNQKPYKASSWDNAIVAHEWGHYISNRLVGNGSGLINQQGRSMGEGWGDFHALLLISEADDAMIAGNEMFQKPYAAITYVASFYEGIRNYPYSTDMDINPLTFLNVELGKGTSADQDGNAEVHDAGEPWAAMLWDSYVGLINDERHTFEEARSLMMDYLVAGYKLTPIAPTYTEARDALLAAAYANDVKDYEIILNAFARRGMGLGAVSPERFNTKHEGVVESYETKLATFAVTSNTLDANYEGMTVGYCSRDGIVDKGETGTVSFTVMNKGSEAFESIDAIVEVTSGQDVTFANDGKITFSSVDLFAETTSSPIEFTLNEAATADLLEFKVSFPDLAEEIETSEYQFSTIVNMDFNVKAPVGNSSTSDMEDVSGLKDFVETIYSGGDLAKGTGNLESQYAAYFPVDSQYLRIKNNGFESDVAYETNKVTVGYAGDFVISWFQYFEIEENWDGGVVEISVNDGDWVDVTDMEGTFEGPGYSGELKNLLPGRETFTGFSPFPGGMESVNFGTTLNGNEVRFRFRMVTDTNSNEFGWVIDNIKFSNIVTPVFHELVAGDTFACENRLPNVSIAANATEVKEGEPVSFTATAVDANASDALTYIWTQTSGTAATLTGADSATLSFTAPLVSTSSETLEFTLTVNDGVADVVTPASIKVNDIPAIVTPPSSNSSGGSIGWLGLLLLPIAALRRRK
ncbi:rhombosortase-dependent M36 family metallopeptidase [Shewanella sp. 5S214]|uniref:rhombosortase-dependent M36 family metallopeptidase n=1 Tax=Shewanella sp. 5S214 TaxID=3229999 RepID=UPI00352E8A53